MDSVTRTIYQSEKEVQEEFNSLRRSTLPEFLPVMLALSWAWFFLSIFFKKAPGSPEIAVILSLVATFGVLTFREKNYFLACLVLIGDMVVTLALMAASVSFSVAFPLGAVVIITANTLLGNLYGLAAILATWGTLLGIQGNLTGGLPLGSSEYLALALYAGVYFTSWIAVRPLRTIASWALSGWKYANKALVATQQHRGEIYRIMRALELANYRIERMNHELILARREAEEARNAKVRLTATVSHELRGPLNLILGFSKLMALSPESYPDPLPASFRSDVNTIYRNCQHLSSLVNDVLDLSQIEAQRLPVLKERTDIDDDIVRNVVEIIRPLAARKKLSLQVDLKGGLPWVLADPVRLRQVLLNLLSNAVRLTENGGITVRTVQEDERVVVSVSDTGPGISPEQMSSLFREFTPLNLEASRSGSGSGLGLSISKHLVELHGGSIWAESELGKGTTIHFSIPLPGTGPILLTETSREKYEVEENTPLVLVVHDDLTAVQHLARQMEKFRVAGLSSEAELVPAVDTLHPSVIISTPANARQIRVLLDTASYDIPLIACGLPHLGQEFERGVMGYFSKPVEHEMIASVMRQVEKDSGTTILIVDDDPDAVRLMERFLTSLPYAYRILKVYDGSQALEMMKTIIPDVVFMDMVMPELDGRETLRRMRQDPLLEHVPVVFITARDRGEASMKIQTPISFSVSQPVDLAVGARLIQQLIGLISPRYLTEEPGVGPSGEAEQGPTVSGEHWTLPSSWQGLDG